MSNNRNNKTMFVLMSVVVIMIGMSFAAVPLYKIFCRMTGFGGTTQVSIVAPSADKILDRTVQVRFNTEIGRNLNWDFKPDQRNVRLKLGQQGLVTFSAKNLQTHTTDAVAVYNVTPPKAGLYFHKIQCFCFGEQTLKPGEKAVYPVVFFVDPDMAKDPNMADVDTITLSYTFFQKDSKELDTAIEKFTEPVKADTSAAKSKKSKPLDANALAGTVALPPEKQ